MRNVDLRVGNFVEVFNELHQIVTIGVSGCHTDKTYSSLYDVALENQIDLDDIYPIRLTTDIVKKIGFEWIGYHPDTAQHEFYKLRNLCIQKTGNRFYFEKIEINYLHQLQNISHIINFCDINIDINDLYQVIEEQL